MTWSEYADLWISANFGTEGGELNEWQAVSYIVAIINYQAANADERKHLVDEVSRSDLWRQLER